MERPSPLVLDACVVLSLYATRRMEEVLAANPGPFLIAEAVLHEALYIHVVIEGGREREPVVLDALLAAGQMQVVAPETEDEFERLFDLALKLDDGEAMSCVLALHRGYRIATDDRKTIRLLGDQLAIVGTLDLVRQWATHVDAAPVVIRDMLLAIRDRGYNPAQHHRHRSWWEQVLC